MAPHATGAQRFKSAPVGPHHGSHNLHLASHTDAQPAARSTLDDFFSNPQIWAAAGLRRPEGMRVQFAEEKFLYPEIRAPRLGWFKGGDHSTQPLQQSQHHHQHHAVHYANQRPERYSSAQLSAHMDTPAQLPVPTHQHASRHASRGSLPPPCSSTHPVLAHSHSQAQLSSHSQAQQRATEPAIERPDLQQLHTSVRRRPRSQQNRVPCPPEQLQQRITRLMAPAPLALLPLPLLPLPGTNLPTQQGPVPALDLALLAQMMPGAAPQQIIAPLPPLLQQLSTLPAITVVQPAPQSQAAAAPPKQAPVNVPPYPPPAAAASNQQGHSSVRVPVILLPPDGHHTHVPAVCVSDAPGSKRQRTHGSTSSLSATLTAPSHHPPSTDPVLPAAPHQQALTSQPPQATHSPPQQDHVTAADTTTTQSPLQAQQVLQAEAMDVEGSAQHPADDTAQPLQQGDASMLPAPVQPVAASGCPEDRQNNSIGQGDCDMGSGAGSQQDAAPAATLCCPPTNSDTSSQHGFAPLRSCGSGCLEEAAAMAAESHQLKVKSVRAVHTAAPSGDTVVVPTTEAGSLDSPLYPPVSAMAVDDHPHASSDTPVTDDSQGGSKPAASAPHSPSSPLSDAEMTA